MKNRNCRIYALLLAFVILTQAAALAESISFEGTVTAGKTYEVYAPIGGKVAEVSVEAGQTVQAGDVLATLETTKVYASESGTITGLFGQPGDSAENIASKYGAVMYIEGESVYSISASTEKAYDATENKFVHVGEEVCLSCYTDGSHTGTGIITAIQGTDFTVKVLTGTFLIGESVNVFREDASKAANRIGRGDLTRTNPTAVSGSGSIVSFAVSNGDTVKRGDLLFETLTGEFDGLYMSGNQIIAEVDGTAAQVNLTQGSKIDKNSVAAVLYPAGSMRIEAQIEEANLSSIREGEPVVIELLWNQDDEVTYSGTITRISAISTSSSSGGSSAAGMNASGAGSDEVTYTVYVDFTPDENTRYGMHAVVTTLEKEEKN